MHATMSEPVKGQRTNRDIETESLYQGLLISGNAKLQSSLPCETVRGNDFMVRVTIPAYVIF